jgi:hypothetical protein
MDYDNNNDDEDGFMMFVPDTFPQNVFLNVTDCRAPAVAHACMKVVSLRPICTVPRVSCKVSGIHGCC